MDIIIDIILWGAPAERPHREVVVFPVPNSQLLSEVSKGHKGMAGVKALIVFAVGTLNFAVVPRRKGFDEFVADAKFLKGQLKHRGFFFFSR